MNKFVVFIGTNGRPDSVYTYKTLRKFGYKGDVILLVDDEDKKKDEYITKFKDEVYVFNKQYIFDNSEPGNNFNDKRSTIYFRNASFEVAKELGYDSFIQLDDDYTDFRYKFDGDLNYIGKKDILSLDLIFNLLVNYLKSIRALSVGIAQGGDFIGGKNNDLCVRLKPLRKCMNSFICLTERPFKFVGTLNEDVNTYVTLGNKGSLFLTIPQVALQQKATQQTKGGMTEIYLDSGTYIKSFYTIMYSPSCVSISTIGTTHKRIHHRINWNNTTPYIIEEKYKKK